MTEDRPAIELWAHRGGASGWSAAATPSGAAQFHQSLPGYHPTPLRPAADLAAASGIGACWVKDESDRLGLPAFKVLGASWATSCALTGHGGLYPVDPAGPAGPAESIEDLRERLGGRRPTLVTATDGNHGRALAWTARLLGLPARVYLPAGVSDTAIRAIHGEGADIVETGLVYDDAVAAAAESCAGHADQVLVQDTAWVGYTEIPQRIVDGYQTLFAEIDDQLDQLGHDQPDLVVVPTGVGSLLQAALEHYRAPQRRHRPAVLAVEPVTAACVTRSLAADTPVGVDTSAPTIMAGLNCGTVSDNAWPAIRHGLDASIGVTDADARHAMADLTRAGTPAGPCGAASLAGLGAVTDHPARRDQLHLGPDATVVLIITEGAAANTLGQDPL